MLNDMILAGENKQFNHSEMTLIASSMIKASHYRHQCEKIATNGHHWKLLHDRAFKNKPIAYIDCLLDQFGEVGSVNWINVPQVLNQFLPWLTPDQCSTFISVILDPKSRQQYRAEPVPFLWLTGDGDISQKTTLGRISINQLNIP